MFKRSFIYLFTCTTVPLTSVYNTLSGKKSRGKVIKLLASDKIFPRLSFSRPVFFCDLFLRDKISSQFFLKLLLVLLFPIYLQNLLLPCFFWCTLFIVVGQSSFNKIFEMRVKVKLKLKVKLVKEKWRIWKISRVKGTNVSELTNFFFDENFPRLFFPDKV